jgi:hypothetical protein
LDAVTLSNSESARSYRPVIDFSETFMRIFLFFKSLFSDPIFVAGERVNHVRGGTMDRTDGYVIGQTDKGVLVEWPRTGASFVSASELSVIG